MEGSDAHESTRLLDSRQGRHPTIGSAPRQPAESPKNDFSARRTVLVVIAIEVALIISNFICMAAQLVILKDVVRDRYYAQGLHPLGEGRKCSVGAVQREVAFVNGWKDVFEVLPGRFARFGNVSSS